VTKILIAKLDINLNPNLEISLITNFITTYLVTNFIETNLVTNFIVTNLVINFIEINLVTKYINTKKWSLY